MVLEGSQMLDICEHGVRKRWVASAEEGAGLIEEVMHCNKVLQWGVTKKPQKETEDCGERRMSRHVRRCSGNCSLGVDAAV